MPFSLRDNAGRSITDTDTITNPISGTPTLNGGVSLITGYNLLTVSLGQGITLTAAGQYRSPFIITQTGAVENGSGTGVYSALNGAYLANAGQVTGSTYGALFHASGTIINQGTIAGLADRGVFINEGGAVQNEGANSVIYGGQVGVADQSSNPYVSNQGSIIGAGFDGVLLGEGGAVYNTGLISGLVFGVEVFPNDGYTVSINNQGSIYGARGAGVYFFSGGPEYGNVLSNCGTIMAGANGQWGVDATHTAITVVNQGLISGPVVGIDLKSGGSIINSGTIAGAQYAVLLGGNSTNQLVMESGAVFIGTVAASTQARNLLELGAGAGVLAGIGTSFTGFQTIALDPGAAWTLQGSSAAFYGDTISGFTSADTLDITDLATAAPVQLAAYHGVVSETFGSATLNLTFAGAPGTALYQLSPDGAGGADITRLISSDTLSAGLDQGITLTAAGQYRSPFTITQTGSVENASGTGVYSALNGAYLANAGQVTGSTYGALFHASGTIINHGTIAGLADRGVFINKGGAVQNEGTNSVIYGGQVGVASQPFDGKLYVSNQGSIIGAGFDGVLLGEGGAVTNTGLISGHSYGVEVVPNTSNAGSINNQGSIYGAQGAGVYFVRFGTGSGNAVTNGGTIMAGAAGQFGVLANLAITVDNHGLISGPVGIELKLGGSVANSGTIAGTQYAVYLGGNTTNQLVIDPSAVFIGTVAAATDARNLLELGAGAGAGTVSGLGTSFRGFQTIAFDPGAVWTLAGDAAGFDGDTIGGFGSADTIWLTDLTGLTGDITAGSGGVLQIPDGGEPDLNLTFSNAPEGAVFELSADGAGGTDVSQAICYLRGTRILTPGGEVSVDALAIGDLVVTRFGGIKPIKWIGWQRFDPQFLRGNMAKIPVRIRAAALGRGAPARDLFVSPGHSVLLGDVLVLASALVNGVSVTQEWEAAPVEYFQIDLGVHDCVMAEGAWAESFADAPGLREQFHNAAEYDALYPDMPPVEELALCAPRPERGTRLEAALRQVVAAGATAPFARVASPG